MRVVYDATTLYVGVTAHDRTPNAVIARILQRDRVMEADYTGLPAFAGDDAIALLFDTFHDRRNAFVFATNPNGAEFDGLITDERREFNRDWRGTWRVATARSSTGWSAEFAIPFRTLRYRDGALEWGFNVFRVIRRKNELALWRAWERGTGGFERVSAAGVLTGLSGLPRARLDVDVKPYALAKGEEPRTRSGNTAIGADLKTELRPGLVLDATIHPDFAQVEVDDQQVNLTRFDLFLPEKRDFFLENAGIFEFGARSFPVPPFLLFSSRRIGVSESGEVPVIGGARLTGRVGGQTIGALSMLTDATPFGVPGQTFSLLRVKRDVGNASYLGAMLADLRDSRAANTAGGLDWSWWPTSALNVQGFVARTTTLGPGGDGGAYRVAADVATARVGTSIQHYAIDPEANAEAGFIPRTDIRRTDMNSRLTFRPTILGIRTFQVFQSARYGAHLGGAWQDAGAGLGLSPNWHTGEWFNVYGNRGRTRVDTPFRLADSLTVPAKAYRASYLGIVAGTSTARPVSASLQVQRDWIYAGALQASSVSLSAASGKHLAMTVTLAHHDAEVASGAVHFQLASARIGLALSTRTFISGLLQANSLNREASGQIRVIHTYRPGSDVFLVIGQENGSRDAPWAFQRRGLQMKWTYLARL